MNIKLNLRAFIILIILGLSSILYTSCKAKKPVTTPAPEPVKEVVEPIKKAEPVVPKDTDGDGISDDRDDCPEVKGDVENGGCPKVIEKKFDAKNIQFEFNSSVLKTSSYGVLEKIAQQMKKSPNDRFLLNGHSSAEGTDQRNMMLSVDRANAVKAYLVNNGIASNRLTTKGFGESEPIADNSTEEGRVLNRRVEINLEN